MLTFGISSCWQGVERRGVHVALQWRMSYKVLLTGCGVSCVSFFSGHKLDRAAHTGHFEWRILQTTERLHERSCNPTKAEDFRVQQAPLICLSLVQRKEDCSQCLWI